MQRLTGTMDFIENFGDMASSLELLSPDKPLELLQIEEVLQRKIIEGWVKNGVRIYRPQTQIIEVGVAIGKGSVIYPNNVLLGDTVIAENVTLLPGNRIEGTRIEEGTQIEQSIVLQASIGKNCLIGPYSYLRPGTDLSDKVKVGAFVETKNTRVGKASKVPHLTYLGDTDVGTGCNIGCGVITANYDGQKKYHTTIGDGVFVGSNSVLVAPIEVADEAYVAAGSTLTMNVPPKSLAIARGRQTNIEGWKDRKKKLEE